MESPTVSLIATSLITLLLDDFNKITAFVLEQSYGLVPVSCVHVMNISNTAATQNIDLKSFWGIETFSVINLRYSVIIWKKIYYYSGCCCDVDHILEKKPGKKSAA
jgi:hypothetical protein